MNISLQYPKHAPDSSSSRPGILGSPVFVQLFTGQYAASVVVEVDYLARKCMFLSVLHKTLMSKTLQSNQVSKHIEVRVKCSYCEVFSGRRRKVDESSGYFSYYLTFSHCLRFKHSVTVNRKKINPKSNPLVGDYLKQL